MQPPRSRRWLPACGLMVLTALSAARAQERRPAFLRVVDTDGNPVAGARITACGSPWFATEAADADVDVVEVRSDSRGRGLLRLLVGRAYSAFAATDPVDDGSFRTSLIAEDLLADGALDLVLEPPRQPQRLLLRGADAWQADGPLQWQVGPWAASTRLLPFAGGPLPPLPPNVLLRVLDAGGGVLWTDTVYAPGPSADRAAEREIVLPTPQQLSVRCVDPQSRPLPGVELWQGLELARVPRDWRSAGMGPRAWRRVGTTGPDGTAQLALAAELGNGKVLRSLLVQARAAGMTLGQAGIQAHGPPFTGHTTIAVPADQVLPITLEPAQALLAKPAANGELLVLGHAYRRLMSVLPQEGPLRIPIADGRGSLPLPRDPEALRVVRASVAGAEPVWAVLRQHGDHCSVELEPRTVELTVQDAAGNPARGARAWLLPWSETMQRPGFDIPLLLEHHGRLRVRVGAGDWFVWVEHGEQCGWRLVHADDKAVQGTLVVAAPQFATLRLVQQDGIRRAGIPLYGGTSCQWDLKQGSRENSFLIERQQLLLDQARNRLTDAEGRLLLPMLPLPGLRLALSVFTGLGGVNCTLSPGDDETVTVVAR